MRDSDYEAVIQAPFGKLGLRCGDGALQELRFLAAGVALRAPQTPLARDAVAQLLGYLDDSRQVFTLPLEPKGTPFQQRVWQALREIPPGRYVSYGELAQRLGTSARAIGGACRCNPLPVIVPCHRIVAVGGSLGGFSGDTGGSLLQTKKWLLAHEGAWPPQ